MKLKLDENGNVVLGTNGHPIYVHDDGSEHEFDAGAASVTIKRLNKESADRRGEVKALKEQMEAFGDLDPAAARDALEKVGKIDAKKLIDAGRVDEVRAEVNRAWEQKFTTLEKERDQLRGQLHDEKIGGAFARSPFVVGKDAKLAIPVDMVQTFFGKNFKLEEGAVRAYDNHGNPIYSRAKPGEYAEFDEALEQLVDAYPHKANILKATQGSGSGASVNNSGPGGKKVISRSAYDAMGHDERADHFKNGGSIVD